MNKILLSCFLFGQIFFFIPGNALAKNEHKSFVRTSNYFLLSGTALENPETIETLSHFDLLILPAEAQIFNQDFFEDVRKRNPDVLILAYVPTVSYNNLYWSDTLHIQLKHGIKNTWWLKDQNGTIQTIWPDTSALNLSSDWATYLANFVIDNILSTDLWDGIFYDEVGDTISWVGSVDTDINHRSDNPASADDSWKKGYIQLLSQTRANMKPDDLIVINGSSTKEYQPFINGRMFESFPTPWEGDGTWTTVTNQYLDLETRVRKSPLFIVNGNTNNTGDQTNYRAVRFGLASTLLGNGYFGFDFGTKSHAQLWQYDEYGAFLGDPKGTREDVLFPENKYLKKSVWERDFSNGKVLVNATDTIQTVRLDGEYEKLHGTQDPIVNNGAIISRVTLNAKDGLLLLRPLENVSNASFVSGTFTRVFNGTGQTKRTGFFAYDARYRGGQQIVHTDLDANGSKETIVADQTHVTIYEEDGTQMTSFYPYSNTYKNGINIAVGDLNGDGRAEIVTGTENGGGPHVRIFNKDGFLIHPGFFAYDEQFRGGVHVAIGDINGDHINEIITGAGKGGGPHVRVFTKDGTAISPGFFAYDEEFHGGVHVSAGDVNGDGIDEIITGAGKGGGPHVRVFDERGNIKNQFFAFDPTETQGVEIACSDVDGDGIDEILGLTSNVFTLSSESLGNP